jgi:hypothetical protein
LARRAKTTAEGLERQRARDNEKAQSREEKAARILEEQRREFQLRTSLLDRAVQCAQKMYATASMFVVCKRTFRRHGGREMYHGPAELAERRTIEALMNFDQIYLEFSAEEAALEIELGARYGEYDMGEDLMQETDTSAIEANRAGETYVRWHQIHDLLTVYYFGLCGNFRVDVLKSNSPRDGPLHSGVDFTKLVPRGPETKEVIPTPDELREVIKAIRREFPRALPALASAALREELRDISDAAPITKVNSVGT